MRRSFLLHKLLLGIVLCTGLKAQAQTNELKIVTRVNAQTKAAMDAVSAAKRATVLVDTPTTNGSAFCIDESGIFATNAHVVEGYSTVKIVVYPGETTQKVLSARVTHFDEKQDLAVLITDPPLRNQAPTLPPLTALPLGDSNTLYETMPVAVFGFPFGTDLALDEHAMPGVTVTTGRVTALRKSQGVLKEVQLDAATNPGNSGGPVINDKGQVIGIIYAGIEGAQGLNFAIPTATLRTLLTTPEIRVDTRPVLWNDYNTSRTWYVRVESLTPFITTPETNGKIEMDFQLGQNGAWRSVKVTPVTLSLRGGEFIARGPIFIEGEVRSPIRNYRIVIRQDNQIVATREGSFPVSFPSPIAVVQPQARQTSNPIQNPGNGHWYQCVNVESLITWSNARAAAESMTYAGLKGHLVSINSTAESEFVLNRVLPSVNARNDKTWIGGTQKAGSLEPAGGWVWTTNEPVKYTNWAAGEPNDAGQEDCIQMLLNGFWNDSSDRDACWSYLVEFEPTAGLATIPQNTDAPVVDGDKTVINLPSPATAAILGGSGRFLLLYLKADQKVAVFDVQTKKIVRYIPALGDNALIAANQDKLLLLLADQNILQRWNLQTGQREQSAPLPDDKLVTSMAMGSASDGPLLLLRGDAPSFLDVATLQPIEMLDARTGKPDPSKASGEAIAVPDGSAFAIADESHIRQMWILAREGNRISRYSVSGSHFGSLPSFDGRWWFSPAGVFTGEGKPVVAEQLRTGDANSGYQILVPAYGPAYFLALRNPSERSAGFGGNYNTRRSPMEVTVYSANDRRALVSLGAVDEISNSSSGNGFNNRNSPTGLPLAKRIYFFPNNNLLVTISDGTISDGMDQLTMRTLDLKSAMSRDGNKYFFVASTPPRKVAKGGQFSYQLDVQSQVGGVKYKVESAPAGLTIGPTGLVTWNIPADFTGNEVTVLVAVSNSAGQELYHTFKVQIK